MNRGRGFVPFLCLLSLSALVRGADLPQRRIVAVLHVHTAVSARGVTEPQTLAVLAAKKNIDVLIPTDHFLNRWEWGLPPFEGLFRFSLHQRDVLRFGTARYAGLWKGLERVHPGLLILPGVEANPAYYWTGHPAKANLTVHDAWRHMLVFGLSPEALEKLPVQSNPEAGTIVWKRLIFPAAAAALGIALMVRWPAGLLVVVLGLLWGINQRPFRRLPAAESYDRGGYRAAQDVIDYVRGRGGLVVWAHPEVSKWIEPKKTYHGAFLATAPYPEAVLETDGATGFGYFWEGSKIVGVPGGPWDQVLRGYLDGRRKFPLWAFGEVDWNAEGREGVGLDQVQNILWVGEKTEEAALDAFRKGRFYVLEKNGETVPAVERWEAASDSKAAVSGESLSWSAKSRLSVGISGTGRVRLEIVRNGEPWAKKEGALPVTWTADIPEPSGRGDFYRFTARGEPGAIISNPIFIKKAEPGV